jgi:hypothetical protein
VARATDDAVQKASMPRILLIGERPQDSSHLAKRLHARGCRCEFATSYQQARVLLRGRQFDLVLSPTRLKKASLLPLIDLLEGSAVTLFYSHAVEQGCWWLPALRRGERCFGSNALRPAEFARELDETIVAVRESGFLAEAQPVVSIFAPPPKRESRQNATVPAAISALAKRKAAG